MTHTPEQIKAAIADLHLLDDSALIHCWKCAHSRESKAYTSYLTAIEKELRKRRKPIETTTEESQDVD